jgi:hypothetical protein
VASGGDIEDRIENLSTARELYKSRLNDSMETRASALASEILLPWHLLAPLIHNSPGDIARHFNVSGDVVAVRLASQTARRLKHGVTINPALEKEFKKLVQKWHEDTECVSVQDMFSHPAYRRIIQIGRNVLPLLFQELRDRPGHWLVALSSITREDPAPENSTFREAVGAWLEWGRDRGYLN